MKTSLVTGGAGFIGSHLCDLLLENNRKVVAVDNFITGSTENIAHLKKNNGFDFIEADVSQPINRFLEKFNIIDEIYHLASPASPRGYQDAPIETYLVNSFGTHHLLNLARQKKSKFLFASTSEVYGDPKEHPQKETYWGNVNPRGLRACYDESKRFGEMATTVFGRQFNLQTRIIRIFNTYGPRMDPKDGRVIPNFVGQALNNNPITVYGDGSQTRSFCYVSDMAEGILKVMDGDKANSKVFNIGNPDEYTMLDLAKIIKKTVKCSSKITYKDLPEDDPSRRKPDISKITNEIGWKPKVNFSDGLEKTIAFFESKLR
jgi:nucleoside-diphosphate-sugar epimerase